MIDIVDSDNTKGDILIVDDNPINLNLLSGLLLDRKYRVRVATNGRRALSIARMAVPDLIMLDINMPEMDGYEVCRQLKADALTANVPVIFISALDEVIDKVRAFDAGGLDYVTKPFQFEEVLARIESQLKFSRLQQELEKKNRELSAKNDELAHKNDALVKSREELIKAHEKTEKIFSAFSQSLPGTELDGKYRLESKIGAGGFGVVYRATHLGLNREVAVKIFRPAGASSPEDLARFRLEGISACRVNHPNAITVLDSAISKNGMAYLVMELLSGHTLRHELAKKQPLSLARAAKIIIPVCQALAEAHSIGIIHRDIKPDNIFLHNGPTGEIVKVVDFGIAKMIGEEITTGARNITVNGRVVGTPLYMAPERISGLPYDGRADVYSLGIVLYRMLTGELPFQSENNDFWTMVTMHLTKTPPPLREKNPLIPVALEQLVLQTLAKNATERPTAKELAGLFISALGSKFCFDADPLTTEIATDNDEFPDPLLTPTVSGEF